MIGGAVSVTYGYDARVEVLGTRGIMFIGHLDDTSVVVCNDQQRLVRPGVKSWRNLFIDAYNREDQGFVESILGDSEPKVTGHDGKMAVKVVNAGNTSIIEKKPVNL